MKRKLYISILLLLTFQLMSCISIYQYVRDKRDRSYREGVELYNQNKIEEAKDRFATVVEIEPDYKDAKQYLKKTKWLLSLTKRNIKINANINYDRGVAFMKNGRYEDALPLLLIAKQQNPDLFDVDEKIEECRKNLKPAFERNLKLAELQYQRKQYIPAYLTCLKAESYNPNNIKLFSIMQKIQSKLDEKAGAYAERGKEFYDKKQYPAALAQYKLARNANPWNKDIQEMLDKSSGKINLDKNYGRGITLYTRGDYFDAKDAFSQVNSIEPGYKATNQYLNKINTVLAGQIGLFYNKGVAYYDKENYQAAINEFNKVLSINPGYAIAREYLKRAQSKWEMQKSVGVKTVK